MDIDRSHAKGFVAINSATCQESHGPFIVYSVVLDLGRNQACSGSMDGTVRVWNLRTGQCQHTLTGHTSLVGLLGLSPSYLVSAAADSTLRIWDSDTGELRHTLAAHTGAITCFQHDEFKVLSGSDGTLKMWNVRDGSVVRDLLTGITGVWQVVFEGRWCVAASNRNETTVLDVWNFGKEDDDEWVGEPAGGIYDEDSEDEDDDQEQADVDAMDQDLVPSESESVEDEGLELIDQGDEGDADEDEDERVLDSDTESMDRERGGIGASRWAPMSAQRAGTSGGRRGAMPRMEFLQPSSSVHARALPLNDETPTKPRVRSQGTRRR
jgi:F-box and WD-40 domain protein CDC4